MKLLLDTHILLWSLYKSKKVHRQARALMNRAEVFVSVASFWELAIKNSIGTLKIDASDVLEALEPTGFELLSIDVEHAITVRTLPQIHKDPFDRMLIAQAQHEGMVLFTHDEPLAAYGPIVRLM